MAHRAWARPRPGHKSRWRYTGLHMNEGLRSSSLLAECWATGALWQTSHEVHGCPVRSLSASCGGARSPAGCKSSRRWAGCQSRCMVESVQGSRQGHCTALSAAHQEKHQAESWVTALAHHFVPRRQMSGKGAHDSCLQMVCLLKRIQKRMAARATMLA